MNHTTSSYNNVGGNFAFIFIKTQNNNISQKEFLLLLLPGEGEGVKGGKCLEGGG